MPEKEKKEGVEGEDAQLQVRLCTKLDQYAVPDTVFNVPASIDPSGLASLVRGLLPASSPPDFDWLCHSELLRGKLGEQVALRPEITPESVITIEFIEKSEPPQPQVSVNHDDWVSAVRVCGDLVLSGCYDNTVNIWSVTGEKKLVIPSHSAPVKAVAWVKVDEEGAVFASASHDQTVNIFRWNSASNSVEGVNTCRGHERSVECLAIQGGNLMATGSFDNTVKIWGASLVTDAPEGSSVPEGGSEAKRAKPGQQSGGRAITRTPLSTLGGHKEAVAGVAWLGKDELASASWDHTIKVWDTEMGGLKTEIVGNKAFFSLSYSEENRSLLATGADRSVRLYDPRATEGNLVKSVFTSHTGWCSAVQWATSRPNLFVSSSHDHLVKMWDQRSHKTPLFELTGHSDKVLCCDWSNSEVIASGAADNDMKVFKASTSEALKIDES